MPMCQITECCPQQFGSSVKPWHQALVRSLQRRSKMRTNQACKGWQAAGHSYNVCLKMMGSSGATVYQRCAGACRKCAENGLDCFAFLGRGVVATGSGAYQMTKQCAPLGCFFLRENSEFSSPLSSHSGLWRVRYPVKESLLSTADGTSNYLHPWQQKLPTESHVPTFRM